MDISINEGAVTVQGTDNGEVTMQVSDVYSNSEYTSVVADGTLNSGDTLEVTLKNDKLEASFSGTGEMDLSTDNDEAPEEKPIGALNASSESVVIQDVRKDEHTHTPGTQWSSDSTRHWKQCTGCSERTDTAAHTVTVLPAVNATCYDNGLTEGRKCSVCEAVLVPQEVILAKGSHTFESDEHAYCALCGGIRTVPMFRMYDPSCGEHFYTGSEEERDILIEEGWNYEGVGFNFPVAGAPVHRLYDPVYGEHLYTMDEDEMNRLLAQGWNYERVAFNSGGEDEVPQYRLHNPNAKRGAYHFTGEAEERDHLISLGWEYQGIGWYSCLR